MIEIKYGRYVPTLNVENNRNIFLTRIEDVDLLELTDAYNSANKWLADHFGFVLLYHNNVLIKRFCNYGLFKKTFNSMNILIEIRDH